MTKDEKAAFRLALIASPVDCPMSVDETCAFVGWSESSLIASTIPRGKEQGRVYFMKSQVQAWLLAHMPHKVEWAA
jgi:hypothetical protein